MSLKMMYQDISKCTRVKWTCVFIEIIKNDK